MAKTKLAIDATVTEKDLGKALQESAMLAYVKISIWNNTKTDRKAMEDVKQLHKARGNVGHLIKNMLAGVDGPLNEVRSAYAAVRTRHYELTLPWVSNPAADRKTGPRLLPHPLFTRYLTEIGDKKRYAEEQLERVIPLYPQMIQDAQPNLGGMYQLSDYPRPDEVKSKFRIYWDFDPIPDGTGFKGLPDAMLERLSGHLASRQRVQTREAHRAMWDEAKERIAHLVDRLATEDTTFKEATVNSVRELVTLLPGWNIGSDQRVDEIAAEIDAMLAGVDSTDLRKDKVIRTEVADQAQRISKKLHDWGF